MYSTEKKKRILIVLYYYHPYVSGVTVMAKRLAESFALKGHQVTILTSQHDTALLSKEMINGVTVIRRPVLFKLGKGVIMPTFWLDIIRYARKHDFVNIHLPMAEAGISSLFIPKKKLITTYHCDLNLIDGVLDKAIMHLSYALMHILMMRSSMILPTSMDYLEHSKMKRYSHKAVAAYPPINEADFNKVDATSLIKKYGLNKSQTTIGFVGRIVYEKGIKYLLQSIPYLVESLDDFKIVIAGDYTKIAGGSIKDELDEYIEEYPGKILFTGYLSDDELKQFYSAIDVLVLPSIDPLEAFGMVQVEAMLCGTPVVASNLPGVREVIRQTGYGLTCTPKDPRDISKKITVVMKNRQSFAPMRKTVASTFNANKTVDIYLNSMQ